MNHLEYLLGRTRLMFACAACLLALPAEPAFAVTTVNTTMVVSATVLSGCVVAATPLAFGNYSVSSSSPTDTTATITATCTTGITYTISLGPGNGAGATEAARSMTNGTDNLNYLLYTNTGRTTLFGDGTLNTETVGGTSALLPQNYTVYGRIPISQQVSTGAYLDTVGVTLSY